MLNIEFVGPIIDEEEPEEPELIADFQHINANPNYSNYGEKLRVCGDPPNNSNCHDHCASYYVQDDPCLNRCNTQYQCNYPSIDPSSAEVKYGQRWGRF